MSCSSRNDRDPEAEADLNLNLKIEEEASLLLQSALGDCFSDVHKSQMLDGCCGGAIVLDRTDELLLQILHSPVVRPGSDP
jgi:hypothetical protein